MAAFIGLFVIICVLVTILMIVGIPVALLTYRICPHCKSSVIKTASVCPKCGRDIEAKLPSR